MSMSSWDDNGGFDPSMAFNNAPPQANFDFSAVQNQQLQHAQLQQRMQNGGMRNGSPAAFQQNPMYQTTPVVPSKRPHGDYMASPQPQGSRSQTPQQSGPGFGGFPGPMNGQQTPTAFQHMNHPNSSNASPSPVMQNQNNFNPPGMPQRMSTASPSPFSPGAQTFAPQPSPAHSEFGGRMDAGANGNQNFMMGGQFNGNNTPSQPYTPPPGSVPGGMINGPQGFSQNMNQAQIEQQRRIMEQRKFQAQAQAQAQGHPNMSMMGHPQQRPGMNPMGQMPGMQNNMAIQQQQQRQARHVALQHHLQQWSRPNGQELFARQVSGFMQQRGSQFQPVAIIAGRQVPALPLYLNVMKGGGSQNFTRSQLWPKLAASVGINPQQSPQCGQELEQYWRFNLAHYEQHVFQSIQQSAANPQRMMGQGQMPQPMGDGAPNQTGPQGSPQDQAAMMHARRSSTNFQTPQKPGMIQDPRQAQVNGFRPPSQHSQEGQQPPSGTPSQPQFSPNQPPQFAGPPPQTPSKPAPAVSQTKSAKPILKDGKPEDTGRPTVPEVFEPSDYRFMRDDDPDNPAKLGELHCGLPLTHKEKWIDKMALRVLANRPDHLTVPDLGHIDIKALTMGLKSGMQGEVRLALDTLVLISFYAMHPNPPLPLQHCGDLLEAVIECAEDTIELLAENAPEFSDIMQVTSYEDIFRNCRQEMLGLQDIPEAGTLEHELDRAAERIGCISNLLRIWSAVDSNVKMLTEAHVIKFISTVIRHLGTRTMVLRNYQNTLEFEKDILIFLSNMGDKIDLPGREEALALLNFLLSFAPSPSPRPSETTSSDTIPDYPSTSDITFPSYQPSFHKYLPLATDAFAKLLARGDPNRAIYKTLFASDQTSTPCADLLTRAFAMSVSIIPSTSRPITDQEFLAKRAPFLCQGLLAGEILVGLIPLSDHHLARDWLASIDGWASSLFKLVATLSLAPPGVQQLRPNHRTYDPDTTAFIAIVNRGVSILRRLGERATDARGEKDAEKDKEHKDGKTSINEANGTHGKVDEEKLEDVRRLMEAVRPMPSDSILLDVMATDHVDHTIVRGFSDWAAQDL